MTTWVNLLRNEPITGVDDYVRNRTSAYKLKEALKGAGWTVIGSGNASTYNWGGSDLWTGVPSGHYWWIALKAPSGSQVSVLLQCYVYDLYIACSVIGYTGTGCNATTWPDRASPPADELLVNSSWSNIRNAYNDGYLNVFRNADNDSFLAFAKHSTYINHVTLVVKLDNLKTGDTMPYWLYRCGIAGAVHVLTVAYIGAAGQPPICRHPDLVQRWYLVGEVGLPNTTTFMNSLPADPASGKQQLLECLAICFDTSKLHIKGRIPGLLRRPGSISVGDTFNGGEYICVGEYALPWDSLTPILP